MVRCYIKITKKLRKINGLNPVFYGGKDFILDLHNANPMLDFLIKLFYS